MQKIRQNFARFIRWSEKYAQTDMIYLVRGGFWLLVGKSGGFLIAFLVMLAFANWLVPATYGTYQYVIAILGLLSVFTLPGLYNPLIKSIVQRKEGTLRLAVTEKLKWGLVGSFLALGLSIWYVLQENYLLGAAVLLVAIFVPMHETFHIFTAFWTGKKRFDKQTAYELSSNILASLLLVGVIFISDNLLLILAAFLVGHTLFDWLLYHRTQLQIKNTKEDLQAISFGKNLTIMSSIEALVVHIDKILVWKFLGPVQVAVYAFAQLPIQKFVSFLPIVPLALPKLGEQNVQEQKWRILNKFSKLFLISLPLAGFVALAAPLLYAVFLPQYIESIIYFQTLSLLIALSPFSLLNAALISDLRKKELYVIHTVPPVLKIALFFLLIPLYGIWGAVVSLILAQVVLSALLLFYFLRIDSTTPFTDPKPYPK